MPTRVGQQRTTFRGHSHRRTLLDGRAQNLQARDRIAGAPRPSGPGVRPIDSGRHDAPVNAPLLLNIAGLVLEVAGLGLAADGYRRTWRDFRNPDDEFLAPVANALKAASRRAYAGIRRLIRRPIPPRTVALTAASMAMATSTARATVMWGSFPSIKDDPVGFAETVELRLRTLHRELEEARDRLHDDAEAGKSRHTELMRLVEQAKTDAQGDVRTIAVGGLREQVAGWTLIVLGVIAAGVANIIQAV